ncbi:glycosyltransferase family 2 protein [Lentibacillus sp. CBA3610]|nr:glycosyltransferase family 2 protein [Lentibacillus sp. CBA3610]
MKDITVIMVDYVSQTVLDKSLSSLNSISSRLKSVIILREGESSFNHLPGVDWSDRIRYVTIRDHDLGKTLHDTIVTINSTYVIFLESPDYLSTHIIPQSLQLDRSQTLLGDISYNRDIVIRQPLLVRTSLLEKHPFLSSRQLPFKEALFPGWLATAETSCNIFRKGLVRQARKNSSRNTIEKQKFIQKYQLEKTNTANPTLSIIMSAYNMEGYAETAVMSCLLQNEQPEQVLIMDDGSTDNTYERLQRYHDESIVKLFSKKNGGKARALNAVLPHVTSDFILELDADDWLDPDAVSVIKKHLADLSADVSVLYGNLRKWKQLKDDVQYKGMARGTKVTGRKDLLSYRFPLGPRVYRTSSLKKEGGFPVIDFADGRLYEDVSVLNRLLKNGPFQYRDFTVYNVREHKESITKQNLASWHDFLKSLE